MCDNALYDGFLTREASSTEKETFELDLTKLKSGVDYHKLRIVVYNEICGTMPCNYCPDDEKDINLFFDKTVTLDCEPTVRLVLRAGMVSLTLVSE